MSFTPLEVNFEDGSRMALDVTPTYERLEEDFEISDGIVLPRALLRVHAYQIRLDRGSPDGRGRREYVGGPLLLGRPREFSAELGVRPRRGIALTLEAERNVLDLAEGSFTTDVFRRCDTQFSPWMSLANNLQYDTVSRLLGWQMRSAGFGAPATTSISCTRTTGANCSTSARAARHAGQPSRDEAGLHASSLHNVEATRDGP